MPTILQLRRGTTAENAAYTGSVGELTVDTELTKLLLHDGSTAGGVAVGDITSVVAGAGMTGGSTEGVATLNVIGGTGITANADEITIDTSIVTTLTGSQTLTNKTLTSPTITGTGTIAGTFTGNITGDVTGNADTATVLETARTIAGQSFDGSANITIAATDLSDTDQSLSTTDNVTFNDLTVSGDLIVSGTTTTVNTETINLADNTITLNSNETGTPSQDGGIEIERGTSTNKTLVWNETTDKWTVGSETFVAGTFEGNLTGDVTGNADTATALETARTIAGQSFDGSANITIASTDLSNTSAITLNTATQTLTNKTLTSPIIATISNSGTLTLPTSTGTIALTSDITAGGGTDWQTVKTTGFTAVAGEGYFINTTSGAFTMTLPASPSIGDEVSFIDYAGTFDSNALTIGRNSQPIQGSASDLTVSVERAANTLVYVDGTQGWLLTNK